MTESSRQYLVGAGLVSGEHEPCAQAVGRLFWGLLLISLDLHLQGFDVIPDVVGYLLIAFGARRLGRYSSALQAASVLSFVNCAFEVISWWGLHESLAFLAQLLGIVQRVSLLVGLATFSNLVQRDDLTASFRKLAICFLGFDLLLLLTGFVVVGEPDRPNSSGASGPIAVALVIVGLLMLVVLLMRLRQLRAWLLANGAGLVAIPDTARAAT